MKQFSLKGFVLVLTILLTACGGKNGQTSHVVDAAVETTVGAAQIAPQYAEGFKVKYLNDGVRLVDIADPENESAQTYHFALVPRGTKPATAEPSKPMPSSKASSSSAGEIEKDLRLPNTSVNQSRTKRTSRFSIVRSTKSMFISFVISTPNEPGVSSSLHKKPWHITVSELFHFLYAAGNNARGNSQSFSLGEHVHYIQ